MLEINNYDNDSINTKIRTILSAHTPLNQALDVASELIFETTPVDQVSLFLKEGDQLICKLARGRQLATSGQAQFEDCKAIIEKAVSDNIPSLESCEAINTYSLSSNFSQGYSIISIPLLFDRDKFGFIYVGIYSAGQLTSQQLDILKTIASLSSIKIDSDQLFGGPAKKRWLREDIKLASKVQRRLQPNIPRIEGWDIAGMSSPMYEVGGDYYDFIVRNDDRLVIALGDIAGKALSAALLMVLLHTAVHAQSRTRDHTDEVLDELNRHFFMHTPSERFATLFYSLLDPKSSILSYSNAGHLPPLVIRRSGDIQRLEEAGLPVGMFPGAVYTEGTVIFKPGDMLVIYSDGITEQVNADGDEFGEERLIEIIQRNLDASASDLRNRIDEARQQFAGAVTAVDDMTVVIVKRDAT